MAVADKISYVRSVRPIDGERISVELVIVGGEEVGYYKKPKYGKGFFLHLYGTKWTNAPGARYPQEKDFKADYTYCRTKRELEERVRYEMRQRSKANEAKD